MASHTIGGQRWADGTSVSVYPAAAQPDPTQQPSGVAVTSAAVSGGQVTFTGLVEDVRYVAWASEAGVRFLVPAQTGSASVPDRARLDSLELTALALKASLPINLRDKGAVDGQNIDAALAAAVAALPVNGGEIVVPKGSYTFTSFPALDGKRAIIIRGESGLSGGAGAGSRLTYTGADGSAVISARSTVGVEFHGLEINNSATNTAPLIDLSATGTKGSPTGRGSDTQLAVIRDCRLQAQGSSVLVDLDHAIIVNFYGTTFYRGNIGVRGLAAANSYANAINFYGCLFLGNVTAHISETGQDWGIFGGTCEQLYTAGGASAGAGAISNTLPGSGRGLVVTGVYFGDANGTGIWIDTAGAAIAISGCVFGSGATAIRTGSSVFGISLTGNQFNETIASSAVILGASPIGIEITGNTWTNRANAQTAIAVGSGSHGLMIMGNNFGTNWNSVVMDNTVAAQNIMVMGNDMSAALSDVTYSAGAMPTNGLIQRKPGPQQHLLGLFQVAGAVSDASFPATPPNGTLALDITNFQIYVRMAGVWKKTVALT